MRVLRYWFDGNGKSLGPDRSPGSEGGRNITGAQAIVRGVGLEGCEV